LDAVSAHLGEPADDLVVVPVRAQYGDDVGEMGEAELDRLSRAALAVLVAVEHPPGDVDEHHQGSRPKTSTTSSMNGTR
jgi:hypothetical protein